MQTLKLSTTNNQVMILGAGYFGRHLTLHLLRKGYTVETVSRSSPFACPGLQAHHLTQGDPEVLNQHIESFSPDTLVIAWAPGRRGHDAPYRETYWDNLLSLKKALQATSIKNLIYISSTSIYEEEQGQIVDESSARPPRQEKANLLWMAEQEVLSWPSSFHLRAKVLRSSGIFGFDRQPGLRLLEQRKAIAGSPSAWINLIHVEDLVQACLLAIEYPESGLWNANGMSIKRSELYQHIASSHQLPLPIWMDPTSTELGKQVSSARLKRDLSWDPKHNAL